MNNPIIYFTNTKDINLEEVRSNIKFENHQQYLGSQYRSDMVDNVNYMYQSLTKEEIEDTFINCLPHTPFKIDEEFDRDNELIKIDVSKEDLITFLRKLSKLKIKFENDKLYLLENGKFDLTSDMEQSMKDTYNLLQHMDKDETSGLFINVSAEIMGNSYTMNSFIESMKSDLDIDEQDYKSFYVIKTFSGIKKETI